MASPVDSLLSALHYPVARARAHFYPSYDTAVTLLLRRMVRHSHPEARVLELGCGKAGYATPWQQFCRQVIGVDIAPAIRHNTWVGCKARGDVYHIPLLEGSVDLVIMRFVIEHLQRPQEAFREVARVLRPGGKLVLLTPNRRHYVALFARLLPQWFQHWYFGRLGWTDEEIYPTFYRANTAHQLRKGAEDVGLRLTELTMYEGPPGYLDRYWFPYLLGVAYERLVNRFEGLAGFRTCILATLQRTA